MNTNKLSFVNIGLVMIFLAAAIALAAMNYGQIQAARAPSFTFSDELIVYPEAVKAEANPLVSPVKQITLPPLPIVPPKVLSKLLPEYPLSALKEGLEGTVLLSVYISASGDPSRVEISSSSGSADLDNSAARAVSLWKFEPARNGASAIESRYKIPVSFKIKN